MQEIYLHLTNIANMEKNMVGRLKGVPMRQKLWEDMQTSNLKMGLSGALVDRLSI